MNPRSGRIQKLLLPLLAALFLAPAQAAGEDGYQVTVKLIMVRGAPTARTDAAIWLPASGGEEDLIQGAQLKTGGVLKILYPVITVYVADAAGNRYSLECPACTEKEPLALTIGDPASGVPFRQAGGRVTWNVAPVKEGLFRIMLDVLTGPEEELVPVAVRGTLFRTEAAGAAHGVTVAAGSVAYGAEGTEAFKLLGPGQAVTGGAAPATGPAGPADPAVLDQMRSIIEAPAIPTRPPTVRPPIKPALKWATLGAGVLVAGAGGAVLMMAASARDQARVDARREYVQLVDLKTTEYGYDCDDAKEYAAEDANDLYDDDYKKKVKPKVVAGWVLTGVGAAAAVGGLIWLLVDPPIADVIAPVTLAPVPLPSGGGITLDWSF
ncbi:MAG: hypothetical protein ABIK09_19560 [Pseudomonadota bacterium]